MGKGRVTKARKIFSVRAEVEGEEKTTARGEVLSAELWLERLVVDAKLAATKLIKLAGPLALHLAGD